MNLMFETKKVTKTILEGLRSEYPGGTRIELIEMNDAYTKIEPGTKGTVVLIDDIGTIHISWDTGSSLGVVYGIDKIKKLDL